MRSKSVMKMIKIMTMVMVMMMVVPVARQLSYTQNATSQTRHEVIRHINICNTPGQTNQKD